MLHLGLMIPYYGSKSPLAILPKALGITIFPSCWWLFPTLCVYEALFFLNLWVVVFPTFDIFLTLRCEVNLILGWMLEGYISRSPVLPLKLAPPYSNHSNLSRCSASPPQLRVCWTSLYCSLKIIWVILSVLIIESLTILFPISQRYIQCFKTIVSYISIFVF